MQAYIPEKIVSQIHTEKGTEEIMISVLWSGAQGSVSFFIVEE